MSEWDTGWVIFVTVIAMIVVGIALNEISWRVRDWRRERERTPRQWSPLGGGFTLETYEINRKYQAIKHSDLAALMQSIGALQRQLSNAEDRARRGQPLGQEKLKVMSGWVQGLRGVRDLMSQGQTYAAVYEIGQLQAVMDLVVRTWVDESPVSDGGCADCPEEPQEAREAPAQPGVGSTPTQESPGPSRASQEVQE